jgi:hypothetical protein
MRIIFIAFCAAALAAGPAMAQTGGVVVSVQSAPSGTARADLQLRYTSLRGARTDCARAMGRFSNRNGRAVCISPRDPLRGARIVPGEE